MLGGCRSTPWHQPGKPTIFTTQRTAIFYIVILVLIFHADLMIRYSALFDGSKLHSNIYRRAASCVLQLQLTLFVVQGTHSSNVQYCRLVCHQHASSVASRWTSSGLTHSVRFVAHCEHHLAKSDIAIWVVLLVW